MSLEDINKLIKEAKEIDLDKIKSNDENINNVFKSILEFIQNFDEEYNYLIERILTSNVRFCDYYDFNNLHGEQIINYFKENYLGSDKYELLDAFVLYVIFKNIQDLIYGFSEFEDLEELYNLLDNNNYFYDILYLINFLQKQKELPKEESTYDLSFLENSKYKILFSGFSIKDIEGLEKNTKKALIKKISGQLSNSDVITLVEAIDHVKDLYNIPIFRVQFANDYRIAYLRKDNVTVILGVTLKTGKPIDYTRYDSIAKNIDSVYEEVDLFNKGLLPKDAQHYKVLELLNNFIKKIK